MTAPPIDPRVTHRLLEVVVPEDTSHAAQLPEHSDGPYHEAVAPAPGTHLRYLLALVAGTHAFAGYHSATWPEMQILTLFVEQIHEDVQPFHIWSFAARITRRHGGTLFPCIEVTHPPTPDDKYVPQDQMHCHASGGYPLNTAVWRLFVENFTSAP